MLKRPTDEECKKHREEHELSKKYAYRRCSCGGRLVAKGFCWRCEDCGFHYARKWKKDPFGMRVRI